MCSVVGAVIAIMLLVAGQEVIILVFVVVLLRQCQLTGLSLPYFGKRATQLQLQPQCFLYIFPLSDAVLHEQTGVGDFEHNLFSLHLLVLILPLPILRFLHDALHLFQLAVVLLNPLLVVLGKSRLYASFVADLFKGHLSSDVDDLLAEILGEDSLHLVEQFGKLRLWLAIGKSQLFERLSLLLELLEKPDFLEKKAALGGVGVAIVIGPMMSIGIGVDILFGLALRGRPHIQYQSRKTRRAKTSSDPLDDTIKIMQCVASSPPYGNCGSATFARTLASPGLLCTP